MNSNTNPDPKKVTPETSNQLEKALESMMDSPRSLEEELHHGTNVAKQLVEHLKAMGAGSLKLPILLADELYIVEVRHSPVTQEAVTPNPPSS